MDGGSHPHTCPFLQLRDSGLLLIWSMKSRFASMYLTTCTCDLDTGKCLKCDLSACASASMHTHARSTSTICILLCLCIKSVALLVAIKKREGEGMTHVRKNMITYDNQTIQI